MKTKTEKTRGYTRVTNQKSISSIVRRYEAGEALRDIATSYGITVDTVRNIALRYGATARPVGRPALS